MRSHNKDKNVTYIMVITPASASIPAETAMIQINKFSGGSPCD